MTKSRKIVSAVLALLFAAQLATAAAIKIDGTEIKIEESDGGQTESVTVGYKEKLKSALKLDYTQKLKVSFKALDSSSKSYAPEQAFLRLKSSESGKTAFFAAEFKDDTLSVVATSSGIESHIGTQGGAFEATILLGNTQPEAAIEWDLGSVEISHRPTPQGDQPPVSKTKLEEQTAVRPEIVHMHRPPVKRSPALVSLVFAVLVFAPLAGFALIALQLGANIKGFPMSGTEFIYAAGFHGGIASILVLYLLFWLKLNLMQTFPVAMALETVTIAFGIKAASAKSSSAAVVASEKATKQE